MAALKTYISAIDPTKQTTIRDPENITRDECLALAKLGAEAWNLWRREFPTREILLEWHNTADFSAVDLRWKAINFSHFEFGDLVKFERVRFDHRTDFQGAQFGRYSKFSGAVFGRETYFTGAQFDEDANFIGVRFGRQTFFDGAQFGENAVFDGSVFGGDVSFTAKSWESMRLIYGDRQKFCENWAHIRNLTPTGFSGISFRGVKFLGWVGFADRQFNDFATFAKTNSGSIQIADSSDPEDYDFDLDSRVKMAQREFDVSGGIRTQFLKAPTFHGCKLHQNTSFHDADFPKPTGSDGAARSYRTLKLAFSQQQATREEQQFFKLEMAEEALMLRNSESWTERGKYWLGYAPYAALSNYGFSVLRPIALFFGALVAFATIYAVEANLKWDWYGGYGAALLQFSAAHALPGLEKLADPAALRLFGEIPGVKGAANYGAGTVIALLFHKAISLLALFLAGLALRNWFKMK